LCGIGGIVKADKRKNFDDETQLRAMTLLMELQTRGTHAWGVYLEKTGKNKGLYCGKTDGTITGEVFKRPESVTKFCTEDDGIIYLDSVHTFLVHTRQQTDGDPAYNENNHPFNTKDFILAHNGVVNLDKEQESKFKLREDIECDSYLIVALIQHFYDKNKGKSVVKAIEEMSKYITGTYACWLYDKRHKDVYLFRNFCQNPTIYYFYDKINEIFIFASEDEHIKLAYNDTSLIPDDEIHTVSDNDICRLEGSELKIVGHIGRKADIPELIPIGSSDRNKSLKFQNDIGSHLADTTSIQHALKELFIITENFDTDIKSPKIIITVVDHDVLIISRCMGFNKLLDKVGFKEFKQERPVFHTEFYKYTITPMDNLNYLVKKLLRHFNKELDIDTNGVVEDDEDLNDVDVDSTFLGALTELANTLTCDFEYKDGHYIFDYPFRTQIPIDTVKLFKKVGFKFKDTNTLKLKDTKYHRGRLKSLLIHMKLYAGDDETE